MFESALLLINLQTKKYGGRRVQKGIDSQAGRRKRMWRHEPTIIYINIQGKIANMPEKNLHCILKSQMSYYYIETSAFWSLSKMTQLVFQYGVHRIYCRKRKKNLFLHLLRTYVSIHLHKMLYDVLQHKTSTILQHFSLKKERECTLIKS